MAKWKVNQSVGKREKPVKGGREEGVGLCVYFFGGGRDGKSEIKTVLAISSFVGIVR